jgi:H+/Cl- antiporter ClcA
LSPIPIPTSATSLLGSSIRSLLAGALGGALAALLLRGVEFLQTGIWGVAVSQGQATQRPLAWCLAIPAVIGLVLGLLRTQQPPARLPELSQTLRDLNRPAPEDLRRAPLPLLAGLLALLGGASLGPEALASHLAVTVGRLIWRGQDRQVIEASLAGSLALFHTPLAGPSALVGRQGQLLWRWLPGVLAGLIGFVCFQGLKATGGGPVTMADAPALQGDHVIATLLSALIGGVVGCGCALALLWWRRGLQVLVARFPCRWTPLLTGLVLGLALKFLPLAPFSGELQLRPLVQGDLALSPALAIVSGVAKFLLAGLCLETGWRGGLIFPVILGSSAIGLGLHGLTPQLDVGLAGWCGSVAGGSLGLLLPSPLVALVLGLTLLQGHGAPFLLVGIAISRLGIPLGLRLHPPTHEPR